MEDLQSLQLQQLIVPSAVNMAAMMRALVITCAAVALSLTHVVTATDYVVGSPDGGWDGRTNYKSWSEAQTFAPGDTLTFKYNSYHNVLEVTRHAFDECITSNPISYDASGSTTVLLTMPGKRYFICGGPGHCLNGMKMIVEVADRPAPTTPTSPPPAPVPPPPPPEQGVARQPAPAPTEMAPVPWAPAAAPVVAAPPRRAGHKTKKHKKKGYCPPDTAPARAPTVQSEEADFPEAAFAPMSSPPPPTTSGSPAAVLRGRGKLAVAVAALAGFVLVAL